jgi:hypothetical protein
MHRNFRTGPISAGVQVYSWLRISAPNAATRSTVRSSPAITGTPGTGIEHWSVRQPTGEPWTRDIDPTEAFADRDSDTGEKPTRYVFVRFECGDSFGRTDPQLAADGCAALETDCGEGAEVEEGTGHRGIPDEPAAAEKVCRALLATESSVDEEERFFPGGIRRSAVSAIHRRRYHPGDTLIAKWTT